MKFIKIFLVAVLLSSPLLSCYIYTAEPPPPAVIISPDGPPPPPPQPAPPPSGEVGPARY